MENKDVVSEKFCRLSLKDEDKRKECRSIFLQLVDNNTDALLKALVELTGKTEDELIEILLRSCPACPE